MSNIKPPRLSAKNKHLWKQPTEAEIMAWLKENCWVEGNVEIVDGKINVRGDVIVKDDVEEFPYPFGIVEGGFYCYMCNLHSLKNSPERVTGSFICSECENLTSLEGAPKEVGRDFDCRECGKQFTVDDVKKVSKVKGRIYI